MNIQSQQESFVGYFSGPDGNLEIESFEKFGLKGELKHYKEGELLISQGKLAPKLFFLVKGFVRFMSVSVEGKEFTQSFASAPSIAGSTRAMTRKKAALFSIEALSDVLCFEFDWDEFFEKMKSKPGFLESYNSLLETLFIKKEEREYAFVQQSAEQRYLQFLENNPQLKDNIPLKMIASHIGITPIALSRIRKKLK
ncbi:MAG: Crp/Fnr family transcriptional regulator [Bermanella sp.]